MRSLTIKAAALFVLIPCVFFAAFSQPALAAAPEDIDICQLASPDELAQLYRKKLVANKQNRGCFWSEKPNSMAYLHIGVHKSKRELRKYFSDKIPPHVKLVSITDLGDEGLMSVSEGSLGVVVIKKGKYVLKSAVTFLEIKPGGKKQKTLWKIYKRILDKL